MGFGKGKEKGKERERGVRLSSSSLGDSPAMSPDFQVAVVTEFAAAQEARSSL
jgi:hypothetical protein